MPLGDLLTLPCTLQLKALPIPVVPLAFDALVVPDDAATILAREKRKKKRLVTAANKRSAATKVCMNPLITFCRCCSMVHSSC